MRSLIFEGKTWLIYEEIRSRDRQLHRSLCRIIKELTRDDPASGLGKPERWPLRPGDATIRNFH